MSAKKTFFTLMIVGTAGLAFYFSGQQSTNSLTKKITVLDNENEEDAFESENARRRAEYEWLITRNPKTGKIPEDIREKEIALLKSLPVKQSSIFNFNGPTINNNYSVSGPSQNGGRTRAIVHDLRFGTTVNNVLNRVIIAGGVSGGLFRSADGGVTWTFVNPPNEIRNISCIVQDPRTGKENTWYAGTGEPIGSSQSYPAGFVYGGGILKSTDNGVTWLKLGSTNVTNYTSFSSEWSFVHKLAIHPITGDLYASAHRRIMRSSDEGASWSEVFSSSVPASSVGGIGDIVIRNDGSRMFIAMSGRNADRSLAGVFTSATGNPGSFTRIAGGIKDGIDSVAGWRAYDNTVQSGDYSGGWGRIVLALSPSNQNILYVMVENALSAANNQSEADLYKCTISGTSYTWNSLGENLVAKRTTSSGTSDKYMELQGGYNMLIAVHPTNPNLVLAGGVNLFKSTDGFATKDNVTFIGGISSDTYDDDEGATHADQHAFSFDPSNQNKVLIGSDGGIGRINDVTVPTVVWDLSNSQYQTIQYYHVGIDPTPGSQNVFGGSQDNATTFKDRSGAIFSSLLPDANDHFILLGGDGGQVGLTKKDGQGVQYLICAAQNGNIYKMKTQNVSLSSFTKIKPNGTGDGEFVTYFHLDPDNTDFLYFATKDSIFRTGNAAGVTSSNWTLMEGVHNAVVGSIFALETTKGPYSSNNHLFIGSSQGKVYRLKDPQFGSPTTTPVDITPNQMQASINRGTFFEGVVVKDIAVNPRNQDTVMVVVSNYDTPSIFWTGNATAPQPTWQVIEGNLTIPSIRSCEIIAKTTGVEYYVGTTIGLFSTNSINGANTVWERETATAGTPASAINNAIVNSIAHRWVDNTMVIGTHGNGMFITQLGSPISIATSISNPIRNNTKFIQKVYPTLTQNNVNYLVGDMYTIKRLNIQVSNMSGAVVYNKETGYDNGQVDLSRLSAGTYILTITSNDRKYQNVQKIIKK